MATENAKDRRLMAYLLGQLSEAERTEVEDRYFADDALFEYLAAVETELIDAYARGELPEPDRVQFETRLLRSPRFRVRIALALQLQARATQLVGVAPGPAAGTSATEASPKAPAPARASAKRSISPLVGAAAAVVTVCAVGGGWWAMQSSRPHAPAPVPDNAAPAEGRPIALSMPVAASPSPRSTPGPLTTATPGPIALVFAPGRDGSATLTVPQDADVVRIQIDHEGQARERYAVIVTTRNRERVWTESNLAPRAPNATGVILQVPATSLPAGDYLVTLSGGTVQARRLEYLADYSLRVR